MCERCIERCHILVNDVVVAKKCTCTKSVTQMQICGFYIRPIVFFGFLIHAMAVMLALSFLLLSQNRRKAFPCSTVVTIKTYIKVKVHKII